MNKRQVGGVYEETAKAFLEKEGYKIVAANYRTKFGEIDLIGYDGGTLCFIEVKYRRSTAYGYPAEAVTARKAATIRRVAQAYLQMEGFYRPGGNLPMCRFDVVSVLGEEITLIRNAF